MNQPKKVTQTVAVPRNTGVPGFLRTVEEILKLPRVDNINIDARGSVSVVRWISQDEPDPIDIDFETLQPHAVIRNCDRITELGLAHVDNPCLSMHDLFAAASQDRLQPLALVAGAQTTLFKWFEAHTKSKLNEEVVYGLPFYRDRHFDDYMLFLCAGYGRSSSLIDTVRVYKMILPERFS